MSTIFMLKGLPASGKTTLAIEMVKDGKVKRVSKDDLRDMLHGGIYTPVSEMFVIEIRNTIIKTSLSNGFDVVVDDTNLNPVHEEQLRFVANSYGAKFEVIEMDTSLADCILRDAFRDKKVGERVIRGMYEKYIIAQPDDP